MAADPSPSAAAPPHEHVLEGLRGAILDHELKPGERLVERDLVEHLGVSRTTVREVLRELTAEGLVIEVPQQGAVVYAPSTDEATDLYAVRASLEELAVRRFVERAPEEKAEALRDTVTGIETAAETDDGDTRALLHAEDRFYDVLLDGAASTTVRQLLAAVQARVRLLRATSLSRPGRPREAAGELRGLVEAIAARDVDLAVRRCAGHLDKAAAGGIAASETGAVPG